MRETNPVYKALLSIGFGKGYASALASGARDPGLKKAAEIFRKTGIKLGPLKPLSDEAARELADSTPEAPSAETSEAAA